MSGARVILAASLFGATSQLDHELPGRIRLRQSETSGPAEPVDALHG
jgi:hypothetical protein